jgi:hypothetical protein
MEVNVPMALEESTARSILLAQKIIFANVRREKEKKKKKNRRQHTAEFAGDGEKFISLGILGVVRLVGEAKVLLPNGEERVALHIHDILATRKRHYLAFDLEDGTPVYRLDGERVTGQRENFFLEYERF